MAKSPEEMQASMIANMQANTGKTLQEWMTLASQAPCSKHGQIVKYLKEAHGLTHGFANLVAHSVLNPQLLKPSSDAGDDLLDAQYAGAKADLRSIYDRLAQQIGGFGPDVEFAPKKTYVSVRRTKQFAILQPSTKTRLDVGLNLKGHPTTERLEASGSFNSMVTHRVRVEQTSQIDAQLLVWLKRAYEEA